MADSSSGSVGATFTLIVLRAGGVPEGEQPRRTFTTDRAVLGRSDDCDLVVPDSTVSRRHAEVRRTDSGWLLVDTGSANGTWIGADRVDEAVLTPGTSFRLGTAELRFEAAQPAAEAEARPAPGAGAEAPAKPKAPTAPPPAAPPSGPPAAPPPPERTPSPKPEAPATPPAAAEGEPPEEKPKAAPPAAEKRPPAKPEPSPPPAAPSEGAPTGEGPPPAKGAESPAPDDDEDRYPVTPLVEAFLAEGSLEEASGNRPFLLDDPASAWFVESGRVEIFTVALKDGKPHGARAHFIGVAPGQIMFGMDLHGYDMGSGFLVVGKMGTRLRRIQVSRLQELAADERYAPHLARMVDGWVTQLSHSLTAEIIPGPLVDVNMAEGERTVLDNQQRARSAKGVLWIEVLDGNLLFIGMEELVFEAETAGEGAGHRSMVVEDFRDLIQLARKQEGRGMLFPVTVDTWVEASNARGHSTELAGHAAVEVIPEPTLWRGLDLFHQVLCQCEFINKRLAAVDEFNRLKTKAEYSEAAKESAYREIAMVLAQPSAGRPTVIPGEVDDPVFSACKLVGEAQDMDIQAHPEADREAPFEDQVAAVAKASRFQTRQVALRDDWWNHDHGPILARDEDSGDPRALVPTGPSSYQVIDPKTGTSRKVNEQVAAELAPFGTVFYRRFPDGDLTAWKLVKFGAHGLLREVWWLAAMGIALGLLGALTPLFTGKLFDTAIPEADRNLLLQYTTALFIAALVSSAFKITQSIAVLRVQGKMDYSIQSALWDRLMSLPSTFFRDYSAGDLADRAQGVNQIRGLVAGAGISSILGSLSSIFYVLLMFKYDLKMAMLAVFLTIVFVSFTFTANYMQLRHQRHMFSLQGAITGLVLQLVAGVSKLRVSGAENHAFRIWAKEYSGQRRLEYKIGRIQNAVEVFNDGFPVIASTAIFFVLATLMKKAAADGGPPPLSTGEFIAFNAAYGAFQAAILALSDASLNLLRVVPIYERLKPIITTESEVDETKAYPGRLKGGIEISHVSFRYTEDGPLILSDVSLQISPGEFVAFVGGSGCGKSTLMRLMLGFEQAEKGGIYYDGQDLASLDLREVRQQMGVVLQNSQLLPADIFRNIVGASSLTVDDAWDAARAAGLAEDVEDMPMGMHTYVSEGGGGLSGGQRQRLLIARALVRKPRILFFDEATSALDNRAQATVTESMERLQATRIVIAHRLSTIINADRICYLAGGKIAEMGSFEELMAMRGLFYDLARRQMA